MPATAQQLVEEPRRALLFDLSNDERLSSNLHVTDWVFDRITSSSNNLALLKQRPYSVGVAFLPSSLSEEQREQVETLLNTDEHLSWVALTNPANLEKAEFRQLIYEHFYDYFSLPLDDSTHLKFALGHLHGMAQLRHTEDSLLLPIEEFHMVGGSKQFLGIFDQIRRVATVDAPVLIRGETGVGKEMIARAVHQRSRHRGGPFVAVNCGALPETLIHAELFGYEKGAFTGANQKGSVGLIRKAHKGTLFLDEIGDMPLRVQARLLRVFQERCVQPLGSGELYPVDIRLISATNRSLRQDVDSGLFRQDLYYRISGLNLELPPLRERTDKAAMVQRIWEYHREPQQWAKPSAEVMQLFERHPWPGNLRQLSSVLQIALAMADDQPIQPEHLPDDFFADLQDENTRESVHGQPLQTGLLTAGDDDLASQYQACGGNISHLARSLGVSRNTLYKRLRAQGLKV